LGDLDQQNQLDIVVTNSGQDSIGILFRSNNGTVINQTTYSTGVGSRPNSVAISDFNNDNLLDIAVANYGTDEIAIFVGYGNRSFTDPIRYTTTVGSDPFSVAVADLNNDHQLDIIVANYGLCSIGIFFGSENGSFAAQKNVFY
jgi:hypothetical protein